MMSDFSAPASLPAPRPEYENPVASGEVIEAIARPLSTVQRIARNAAARHAVIVLALILIWQVGALWVGNSLTFPTFIETARAFIAGLVDGSLGLRTLISLKVLLGGYFAGLAAAALATAIAATSDFGTDILSTLTAMFNPLPAIALLPLALLWFGLGTPSLVFVIAHSVIWAVALNTVNGFRSVPQTQRMAGMNYGLRGIRFLMQVLVPAAFPSILTGMKIGWAFAWRTLIAAELVFGVTSNQGGLGWFIFESRNELDIASVFAGLLMVTIIGLIVENVIFRAIEARTVRRWGMQS
jgi:NitT/TauT family transport system permease protein